MVTQDEMHTMFRYEDGNLIRIKNMGPGKIGDIAGCTNQHTGETKVKIRGRLIELHRWIWFFHHGEFPTRLNFIDGDRTNTRIENLKDVSLIAGQIMDQEYLNSRYTYDNGNLTRKITTCGMAKKGDLVGHIKGQYLYTEVLKAQIGVHRVIFMMHHGYLPEQIDHINGDKHDNRIENLRAATASTNGFNRSKNTNNTSGYKGVSEDKATGRFRASIKIEGERIHLGMFPTAELAAEAYDLKAKELHKEFYNGH